MFKKNNLLALVVILLSALIIPAMSVFGGKSDNIELQNDDAVILNSVVDGASVDKVINRLNELNAMTTSKPINLVIASPGGSIIDGLRLNDYAKGSRRPINTITLYGYSMGFQIMQSLGTRYVVPSSNIMSHKARGGVQGEFGGTLDGQLVNRLNMWLKIIKVLDENTAARTKGKMPYEDYIKAYENEMWVYGDDIIKKGFADKMITVTCGKTLSGSFDQKVNFMGLEIVVTWSNCPMIQEPLSVGANVGTNKGTMSYEDFKNQGGLIGGACYSSPTNLCLINSALTYEMIEAYKNQGKNRYYNKNVITYTELGK